MALNLKNTEVERLVNEVARMTGETKTEAIRKALLERKSRLSFQVVQGDRNEGLLQFLEREIWASIPPEKLGRRLSQEEEAEILGFGPDGI